MLIAECLKSFLTGKVAEIILVVTLLSVLSHLASPVYRATRGNTEVADPIYILGGVGRRATLLWMCGGFKNDVGPDTVDCLKRPLLVATLLLIVWHNTEMMKGTTINSYA